MTLLSHLPFFTKITEKDKAEIGINDYLCSDARCARSIMLTVFAV